MGNHPKQLNLQGQRVTVMGLGHFGGNIAAIKYLSQLGARLTVTDQKSEVNLQESIQKISNCQIERTHFGEHVESDFIDADLIVASPAIPPTNSYIHLAMKNGIPVTTEMNLFWENNLAPVVAVTGSNGKSTTSAMIHSILTQAGYRTHLGGNIGRSLLENSHEIKTDHIVVLELSSFQLEYLNILKPAPFISVVTNFSANHLDWHGDIESYEQAKQNISRWQNENQFTVIPFGDEKIAKWKTSASTMTVEAQQHLKKNVIVPGDHNLLNASFANAVAQLMNISESDISKGLESFNGLPHRLEKVAVNQEREFYNDSLATTPESSIAAIHSFDKPIYLIAGGYDKKVDLTLFADEISQNVQGVALIGDTATEIEQLLNEKMNEDYNVLENIEVCSILEAAVKKTWEWSSQGAIILLSPGCASYGQFSNFVERGECFKKLVHDLGRL